MGTDATAPPTAGRLEAFKEYLSDPRYRIRLDDEVIAATRATLSRVAADAFPVSTGQVSGPDFAARLAGYEAAVAPLQAMTVLLGKWATPDQQPVLTNALARLSDHCGDQAGGNSLWLALRWYPVSLLMYPAGIAALSADNFGAFAAVHTMRVRGRTDRGGTSSVGIVVPVAEAEVDVLNTNAWRCVEEYKQKRTPESEHLFTVLRPVLDDQLFLGAGYENLFDRYEVLRALVCVDLTDSGRGPVGRFGWKYAARGANANPFAEVCAEAGLQKERWGPIRAGLFRGSYARFEQAASKFEKDMLSRLNWY